MKAIIPMAGFGKRLRPHTFSHPKPLITVAGQPMLKYLLDALAEAGIDEYIFIVGYLGDQIEEYITQNHKFKATFVVQDQMIGQSHAVYLARDHLSGPAILLFADTLFETDLGVIKTTDADAIAFVREVEDPRRFGVVKLDGGGRVTQFVEKPDTDENKQAVIGMYYIRDSSHMLSAIEQQMKAERMTKGEFYIADAFQIMIEQGAVFKTQRVDVWLDCGKPDTVLETNRYLLDHGADNSGQVRQQGVMVIPPVNVHPTALFESAVIGPYVSIGAECRVSHSIVRDSVIDAGADVSHTLLDQSLVGRAAHVRGHWQSLNITDESDIRASLSGE